LLPDPASVPQDARRELLRVLASRGRVKPSDLGVSRAYFYQMKRGLRPVPDYIVKRLIELASDDDLAQIPYFAAYVDYSRIRGYDVERLARLIMEWMKANPASAKVLIDTISLEAERLGLVGRVLRVTGEHLSLWERWLEDLLYHVIPPQARAPRSHIQQRGQQRMQEGSWEALAKLLEEKTAELEEIAAGS